MRKKVTTRTLLKMKSEKERIAMMTAYDYPSAKIAEEAGSEILLVGDSLGMVVLGYESTIPVTLADMIHHTKAVTRGSKTAMVIADLPFMTAHLSEDEVLKAAARLMQEAGAYGIKIEGGSDMVGKISKLTKAGIPVMGHIGLTPQSVNQLGGYLIQGRDTATAKQLLEDAQKLELAGAFSLVLECVPEELSQLISETVNIPVIGIGAGRFCDGQVLVYHDLLAIGGDWHPSFVKVYQEAGKTMTEGIASFVDEVKKGIFPEEKHSAHLSADFISELYGGQEEGTG
ncbi:3-methyl-2-oxobutanoate hydroxymethyltransferase [Hazenella sp. IB182357]|uniref:3-methyl-2-oxobutanoate hydroxymethyltransferase n=1 Tax=Polycladospora coralii TaxID=2771432 RepID=A0A926N9T4_9BACL|nr:3-methyl-2-oxobutanoate hydroxymethyltransferase [Polycladospora coralii]MBD1371590.1 3-methyl-2-oxobutanoate hydroxymethyltransferase [Polycladospora coralii]MBS7529057.1 3-methyl-2-oxobutanoate hydroxymethyltransferase [Polycladospora coralii]